MLFEILTEACLFCYTRFLIQEYDWSYCFLCGIPMVSHTIVVSLCLLIIMSCKDCIAFWIHVGKETPFWIFL